MILKDKLRVLRKTTPISAGLAERIAEMPNQAKAGKTRLMYKGTDKEKEALNNGRFQTEGKFLTRRTLAWLVGVAARTYDTYEDKTITPRMPVLKRIAEVYGVPVSLLIDDSKEL